MHRFFPPCEVIAEARHVLADGHFGELDALMGASSLAQPHEGDLDELIGEFVACASMLGFADDGPMGFVVLVPVTFGGVTHTTPVLVDTEHRELSFTSHPELGADVIADEVLVANPRLLTDVRTELLGVLATWHNSVDVEE